MRGEGVSRVVLKKGGCTGHCSKPLQALGPPTPKKALEVRSRLSFWKCPATVEGHFMRKPS